MFVSHRITMLCLSASQALTFLICSLALALLATEARASRIKDIAAFHDERSSELIGYGLVIGLNGTGDGKNAAFTSQSLANMITRMGLTVDPAAIKVRNVASVIVTAAILSHHKLGATLDVTVSSVGDASSLQGGMLLITPLAAPDGAVYATAQGSVSIGGFNVSAGGGNQVFNNYTLVGRVPDGARITRALAGNSAPLNALRLTLSAPDYTTAGRIAEKINLKWGRLATAQDDANVLIALPDSLSDDRHRTGFMADVGQLTVTPDAIARVVINEKTGTIVAGEHVTIAPVAIAHGSITVNVTATPVISQPEPFSGGETVTTSETEVRVEDQMAHVVHMEEAASIAAVANALNAIGATPRDIIAIFQALKQAGALRAELTIL